LNTTIRENLNRLFNEIKLDKVLVLKKEEMLNEIKNYDGESVLKLDTDNLCEYFSKKYSLIAPILKSEEISISTGERDVDLNKDYESSMGVVKTPKIVKGTYVEFALPFEGDSRLFRLEFPYSTIKKMKSAASHSRFGNRSPYGVISTETNELLFKYTRIDHDSDAINRDFSQDLEKVQEYLEFLERDISKFNDEINNLALEKIEERKKKLLADRLMIEALNYPIKKYHDAENNYAIPLKRKIVAVEKPIAKTESCTSEPLLKSEDYDEIIKTISNMALVIERNPKAFRNLNEEDIRTFILMFLNGYYEGNATGETFNLEGKTDILIRVEGRNIFIAECKFWKGPTGITETIDQLLGYTSWRDTKTAIIFFNRNKNLTSVIGKIPETVSLHSNYIRRLSNIDETTFRFVFHQRDDKNKEILLTILIFDMPID
jgi:hypothetical protein